MTKTIVRREGEIIKTSEDGLLELAKNQYHRMQRTWWDFAKVIHKIRTTEAYKSADYETFKDFCEAEYPSTNYKVILKFCAIAESLGHVIESKLEKDKEYALPAYESCYTLTTLNPEAVSREEIARIKRDVLEKKLSWHKLKDRVKELIETKRKEAKEFVKKSEDEIEKLQHQLEEEIDLSDEEEAIYDEAVEEGVVDELDEEEPIDDLVAEDFDNKLSESLSKIEKLAKDLTDQIEVSIPLIEETEYSKSIEKFAIKVDKAFVTMDKLLTIIQEKN